MAATLEHVYRILNLWKSSQKILTRVHNIRSQYMRNRWSSIPKYSFPKTLHQPAVLVSIATVRALSWFSKKEEDVQVAVDEGKTQLQKLLDQADELYAINDIQSLYNLLKTHAEVENDEILWRLARASCDMSKRCPDKTKKRDYMFEGFEYIKRAIKLNDQSFACQKWYAIMLDKTAEFEGTKKRISNAYLVKEHFMKAIELNPKDATSIYSLGYWCFLFADMPWYTKKIASAIFATPPSSTYEEALKYLEMAEKVDPNFYSMNHLMLGKTYLRLGNREVATIYLRKARDYPRPLQTPEDKEAFAEAVKLLKDNKLED